MNNETKEILNKLLEYFKESNINDFGYEKDKLISYEEAQILLDYITNLQEEVEDLKEDNYAYHQLMKIQNKREYRSKFLKEFQEEFGTNTFPDYDEIYKRYDKVKKENEENKQKIEKLTNNLDELYEYLVEKSQNSINYETIYLDILDKMEKWR